VLRFVSGLIGAGLLLGGWTSAVGQSLVLPAPSGRPFSIDSASDPILAIARDAVPRDLFQQAIAAAVAANPTLAERRAGEAETQSARREARAALFPVIDLGVSGSQAIARKFSNDPNLIVERSRPPRRFDVTASVQQTLFDFGAASRRIEAAAARIDGAAADSDQAAGGVALLAIGAWYDVFAYGALSQLARTAVADRQVLDDAIDARIKAGVSAPIERARVDASIASARLRLAQFEREQANATARYSEIFGAEPAANFRRAPAPDGPGQSQDYIVSLVQKTPVVRAARASARAAQADARAAHADTLPSVTAGIDASRFGILEAGREDFDVRARVALRQRFFGPGAARADQARARASGAAARAAAVEGEAVRQAKIAWSDVESRRAITQAYETNYVAARMTRDGVVERFRVARGTLFDVLDAEDRFFDAAASYIRALSEYDTARYILLARSGQLLDALQIGTVAKGSLR
jgi:outer membrane protein, adhesin transport system